MVLPQLKKDHSMKYSVTTDHKTMLNNAQLDLLSFSYQCSYEPLFHKENYILHTIRVDKGASTFADQRGKLLIRNPPANIVTINHFH